MTHTKWEAALAEETAHLLCAPRVGDRVELLCDTHTPVAVGTLGVVQKQTRGPFACIIVLWDRVLDGGPRSMVTLVSHVRVVG